jgi:hypothetical protein
MALHNFMPVLVGKMKEVAGIEQVYSYEDLPGVIGTMPAMIVMPLEGVPDYSAGGPNTFHHEIQATLYVTSQMLPSAYGLAVPFIELVLHKIAGNMTLDNNVEHCLPSQAAPFYDGPGGILYAKNMYLGIIFRFTVKENEAGDYTVAA